MAEEYDVHNPPSHSDPIKVGKFVQALFEESFAEKENLSLPDRWFLCDRLFKGDHWGVGQMASGNGSTKGLRRAVFNLLFSNIQRTVANITARAPVAEVFEVGGDGDKIDNVLTDMMKQWNNESEHGRNLTRSVQKMEKNGITIEKGVYDEKSGLADIVVLNPYGAFPAAGYYEEINDMPYFIHAEAMSVEEIASKYGVNVKDVETEDLYSLMGEDREETRTLDGGAIRSGIENFPNGYSTNFKSSLANEGYRSRRALVLECWLRDYSKEKITTSELDDNGKPIVVVMDKYPGGIRVITVCNKGDLVLKDGKNPNINHAAPRDKVARTWLYDRFPFWYANSFESDDNIWGMTAAEMTAPINQEINRLLTRLGRYLDMVLFPPLILPKDTGLTRNNISNQIGLVLTPADTMSSRGIRYLQVPPLPSDFWRTLDWLVSMFDRIYQIEDADRGEAPSGVIAASAIMALQERGAVMMRAKIRAVDYLVRNRGRAAVSFLQNFGIEPRKVDYQGQPIEVVGIDLLGRQFNYEVESGSTVHRTSLQTEEQAKWLAQAGKIDTRALLETINFPNWKQIIERMGENQLDAAMQVLIDAGLPEEDAQKLREVLMQQQVGADQQAKEKAVA